jgi:GGDEF domain-containing protein
MTSPIKSLLRRFDEGDSRLRRIILMYRGAIAAVKDNLVVSRAPDRKLFRIRLERLLSRIEQWSGDDQEIGDSLVSFIAILSDYRLGEEHEFAEQQQQLRKTVVSLSSLVETIRQQHGERGRELEEVTMALESALFEPDAHRIHEMMQQQIRTLKSNIVGLSELSFDTTKLIGDHIAGLERIAKAHDGASSPGLSTGMTCPGEEADQDAVLRNYIDRYELFCVLSAELGGLDDIQREWGIPALNHIQSEFAKRVERACAGTTVQQIWRKGKVFLVLNQAIEQASQRQAKLRINLTEPFHLTCPVGKAELRLPFQLGLAEYAHGESLEDLMRRLYESAKEQQLVAV